jgi:hypothetical protein
VGRKATAAWAIVATPHSAQFPETEVGAVSAPRTITLIDHGHEVLGLASLALVMHGGTGEAALAGEFELVDGQPRSLGRSRTWTSRSCSLRRARRRTLALVCAATDRRRTNKSRLR